jgi:hypothetical protein
MGRMPRESLSWLAPGEDRRTHIRTRMKEYVAQMLSGPGAFRFFLQPAVAVALGIIHGVRDCRAGRPPYLLDLYHASGERIRRLTAGLREIWLPLLVAVAASMVFQYVIRRHEYVAFAVVYAAVFVAVPYFVTRALSNRVARRSRRARRVKQASA